MEIVNNRITGKISGDVLKTNGKAIILRKLLEEGKFSRKDCLIIADDRNNLPMFLPGIKTIGYYPDPILAMNPDMW